MTASGYGQCIRNGHVTVSKVSDSDADNTGRYVMWTSGHSVDYLRDIEGGKCDILIVPMKDTRVINYFIFIFSN